jgi:hypothetical protein
MSDAISAFIDDELTFEEKIDLVERLGRDENFSAETLALLRQETRIRAALVDRVPEVEFAKRDSLKRYFLPLFRPLRLATAALAAAVVILLFSYPAPPVCPVIKRFVIYRPGVSRVDITGSFTDWRRVPMRKLGASGYWEIHLPLPTGEHRYTYILEGSGSMADPTVSTQERDDFGGRNSIIYVGKSV